MVGGALVFSGLDFVFGDDFPEFVNAYLEGVPVLVAAEYTICDCVNVVLVAVRPV